MKYNLRDRATCLGILVVLLLAAKSQVTLGQERSQKVTIRSDRAVRQAAASKESEPARKRPQSQIQRQTRQRPTRQRPTRQRPTRQRPTRVQAAFARQSSPYGAVQPAVFGFLSQQRPMSGYGPRHQHGNRQYGHQQPIGTQVFRQPSGQLVVEHSVVDEGQGEISYADEGPIYGGCDSCCDRGGQCGDCGSCESCCLIPCPTPDLSNLELLLGVHGTTGPRNWAGSSSRTGSGSFGFQSGLNWAVPIPYCSHGYGMQFGFQGNWNNGDDANFVGENRKQMFVPGGAFRRVDYGFQWGLVLDYLYDDWYYQMNLTQLRGEFSWVYANCTEVGFWFNASTNTSRSDSELIDNSGQPFSVSENWEATDIFAFFFRRQFDNCWGSEARLFAGFTGESDGLIGADFRLPFCDTMALETGFTYLIPEESSQAWQEESWGLGINLVWTPYRSKACCDPCTHRYFRPLFNVANNRTFLVDRIPGSSSN